jgi:large subunit ribosomal protein L24
VGLRIRKGDLVQVIAGADKGRQGRVTAVDPERGRVRVEKVRLHKRHLKPGRKAARTGGIIEQESFIHASNVMLVDPKTGRPSRVRVRREGGRRIRVFAKSGDAVPAPVQV